MNSKKPLIRLIQNLRNRQHLILAATFCSITNKILDLAPPVLIGLSVDVVVRENLSWLSQLGFKTVPSQLLFLAIISFVIWSAESLFEYLYGLLWRNLAQSTQHNLRISAYDHLQKLELQFFENDSTGRLMTILNDDINQLERFLDHGANQIIQLFVTVIAVGTAMAILSLKLAFFAFIPIPLILIGSIRYQKMLEPLYKNVRERAGDLASRLSNNLSGMLTIKSFANEKWELERLQSESNAYRKSNKNAIKLSAAFIPLIRFAILFAFLSILIIGGFRAWKGELAVGTYSFLIFITQRLLWPLTTLGHTLDDYQRSMASVNRVLNLIDQPITIIDGSYHINPKDIKGNITFEKVDFNYINSPPLFQNFSLKIEAGTTLGIVGTTGSGKSTLVKLLLRLYKLNSGNILIDDLFIDDYKLRDLRRCISLVSQDVYLFHGTVYENIAYGSTDATFKEIKQAAELSECADFINNLPNKYQTLVGERGQRLSGGQRQRIALARAILKNAPILILDEATASVDNETEAAIQRSLAKITENRTTIIIAHRLSTIIKADKIIVLSHGKIIDTGKHDELLINSDTYKSLWCVQAGLNKIGN